MSVTDEAPVEETSAKPQPWPVNAKFGGDFVTQLVLAMSNMTVDELAQEVASHVIGKRLPAEDRPMQVTYEGKVLDGSTLVSESGIVPVTNIYVDYVRDTAEEADGSSTVADAGQHRKVGPVLRMGDDIGPILSAIEDDNPDARLEVVDQGAYVRVETVGRLVVTRASIERRLGRPFEMRQLEAIMAAFSGRIQTGSEQITWHYEEVER